MDIRELRVGNWFIDHEAEPETTIYWQVEGIERVSNNPKQKHLGVRFRSGSCWSNASIIEPIPLTEEWLVKFGFEKVNNNAEKHYKKGDFNWYSSTNDEVCVEIDTGNDIYDFRIDCKYVHSLQNLHFSLTGEELQIKDND